ncbi:MAG: hydrogenase maturation protease [Limimaricola sp.]|nr:hydrogenase maturation protease [Limimaricola sp.]
MAATLAPDALILGIGNTLLQDDGIGVHLARALEAAPGGLRLRVVDGGTVGLSLLNEIETALPLVALDAMEMEAPPGTVCLFTGAAMDRQLLGRKTTAHEVALADLMQAASFAGRLPTRRALLAVQPAQTTWGLAPTADVAAAMPQALQLVLDKVREWRDGA